MANTAPNTGFIILSWNGSDLLTSCLQSLEQQSKKDFIVCLVDNGSTDNTLEVFDSSKISRKVLVKNGRNLGFAPAVNQGVTKLLADYDNLSYIVLLNNDVALDRKWLENIRDFMDQNDGVGFAQGVNYTEKNTNNIDSTGIYVEEGFIPRQKTTLDALPKSVGPNAAAMIMRREFVEDIAYKGALLDATFFAYVEDVDLLLRAFLRGWKHAIVTNATAVHGGSKTGERVSVKKMYWGSRNMVWLVTKNVPFGVWKRKWLKIYISRLADIEFLFKTNKNLMFAYVYGLIVGIILSPRYYAKRHHIFSHRRRSDDEMLEVLTPSSPPVTNPIKYLKKRIFK